MLLDTPSAPNTDRLLELIATLVVAVGGTIGGALLALKKALKPVESQIVPPSNGNGHSRLEKQILEGHARLERLMLESEARLVNTISGIDKRLTTVEAYVEMYKSRMGIHGDRSRAPDDSD